MNDKKITIPLPCLVCRKPLEPAIPGNDKNNLPWGALMFAAHGNYGSRVYDPMSNRSHEYLMVNICDSCTTAAAADGVLLRVNVVETANREYYSTWTPEGVGDDDA